MHSAQIVSSDQMTVEPSDRGFSYGDGLFETMAASDGRVRWLDKHMRRLRDGCRRIAIPLPATSELEHSLMERVPRRGFAIIKLIVTRGTGPRGYCPPDSPSPLIIVDVTRCEQSFPLGRPDTFSLRTLSMQLGENPRLAGIKHLSRLENVLAQAELKQTDADEGLLLSSSGKVIGGTHTNLFCVSGSRLATPRVDKAGVAGVMRAAVIEAAPRAGLETVEADLSLDDVMRADELFVTNAIKGPVSVGSLDGKTFRSPTRYHQLIEILNHDAALS